MVHLKGMSGILMGVVLSQLRLVVLAAVMKTNTDVCSLNIGTVPGRETHQHQWETLQVICIPRAILLVLILER